MQMPPGRGSSASRISSRRTGVCPYSSNFVPGRHSKRERLERFGGFAVASHLFQPLVARGGPDGLIPDLELVALAQDDGLAPDGGQLAQLVGNEDPALAVQLAVAGVAAHHLLGAAASVIEVGKGGELGLNDFPFGQGVKPQGPVEGIQREDEPAFGRQREPVAVTAGDCEPPLAVQTDRAESSKHWEASVLAAETTFPHISPLTGNYR